MSFPFKLKYKFYGKVYFKMDSNYVNDNTGNHLICESDINDPSQLEMIRGLGEDSAFDDPLIPTFENDLTSTEIDGSSGIIMQHMDIQEPLSELKCLLENKLDLDLTGYMYCLQGSQLLESHKNLVDQCVQGKGLVQINVEIQAKLKRINIVDVLKPAEDYFEFAIESKKNVDVSESEHPDKNVIHWEVDNNFKLEQERLKIPFDPEEWDAVHVKHWVQWAVRHFSLPNLKLSDWAMTGKELIKLSSKRFQEMVPIDPGDIFWLHLEVLKQHRVIATLKANQTINNTFKQPTHLMKHTKVNRIIPNPNLDVNYYDYTSNLGNRSGNNGQIQLWQFLLELLTSPQYISIIHWLDGNEGEFKLSSPEIVAQLWGERKNKPAMNYEKLSRALRYYYYGDMISKVQGKRFVYKFVCDLKQLLGYSAFELANLVTYKNANPKKL